MKVESYITHYAFLNGEYIDVIIKKEFLRLNVSSRIDFKNILIHSQSRILYSTYFIAIYGNPLIVNEKFHAYLLQTVLIKF